MSECGVKPGTLIEVTDEHIDQGIGSSCFQCAISLAIREHTPPGSEVFTFADGVDCYTSGKKSSFALPRHVGDFIKQFDRWWHGRGERPEPISFVVPDQPN